MSLSWNEVRDRAIKFARDWKGEAREQSERQTFWNEFFNVFGLSRRAWLSFEAPVRNLGGNFSRIDGFWRSVVLIEHKSLGENLGRAQSQAFDYMQFLINSGRGDELPRYLILSDFARIALLDLEPEDQRDLPLLDRVGFHRLEFPLHDLHKHVRAFAFIKGEQAIRLDPQDPANEKAYQIMADLHDALAHGGLGGHELERFLVRVLFCLFAEDTSIFEPNALLSFLEHRTRPDGSDLGAQLNHLFEVLNTPEDRRSPRLDEDLAAFPYVNGRLFEERLGFAEFNSDMRNALLGCCRFQWAKISPAVFGSLFQGVMEDRVRRQQGAHYTSERDIMKVIRSLFLDELQQEFAQIKADRSSRRKTRLDEFHERLARLKFLDPACGCGNFLVLTYRELRLLELEVLKERYGGDQTLKLDLKAFCRVDVDQFYGIEISEWPSLIAEVAMWLLDHQMNLLASETFGERFLRLPLKKSPRIRCDNALRLDWKYLLPPAECSYVLGNPPFVGKQFMSAGQKADMAIVCGQIKGAGVLDFVTGWYFKAAEYSKATNIRCAFVSTNSISQGEQPGILWGDLFSRHQMKIHFAHRTFPWESESRGKAHVHVIIIGFGSPAVGAKFITDYDTDPKRPTHTQVSNVNPYLVEGNDAVLLKRSTPFCAVPEIVFGSMPNDGGHLLLDAHAKAELLKAEPGAKKFVRPFLGSDEFINGIDRWCLWLVDALPSELDSMPQIVARIEGVKAHRLASTRETTRELASTPTLFGENRQPRSNYLLIPGVSSERRAYIPIGFLTAETIASNLVNVVPNAELFHFGVLTSRMHMAWVRYVCGRLKSDFRYSAGIVYNNYPWPTKLDADQRRAVEMAAQVVLKTRESFHDSTLAQLYKPVLMPPELVKAHAALDRAVDRCYRPEPFPSDRARVEHLFALYEQLAAPLIPAAAKPKRTPRKPAGTQTGPAPNSTQAELDAAHFYFAKETPAPYRFKPPETGR